MPHARSELRSKLSAAALLALGCVLGAAGPAAAQGQTVEIVSNLDRAPAAAIPGTPPYEAAVPFTVGDFRFYNLIDVAGTFLATGPPSPVTASIRVDGPGGEPGAVIPGGQLNTVGQTPLGGFLRIRFAPPGPLQLMPGTRYWVVVTFNGPAVSPFWMATTDLTETGPGTLGPLWLFAAGWTEIPGGAPLVRVRGEELHAVPTLGEWGLILLSAGLAALVFLRSRSLA